ncbi:leucyl/phenylalanyl-tRNA--protein transferase [Variovorax arabinosiphilus]|uniref:leucyl/phenylalanyl-tRNA--protein transferase n=1 Tax=Variovorax arabinosiphilus TaxID=3053498 RepID=UPI00257858C7|nr:MULTISPECIES: leucyl/phenylalanyl-tRNA--protein transferase [unclassified Variovorax]MDM0118290.1 leucyl/phenylalanyl-tRNA--protein transferase [Variovorax sp. J2L1-78]MDM0128715.1 leucyl/phenylalanyl-tRNA--protein transferase [Variovorax sp. J2L1-63]MDM0233499.1 leucyl/phenylalanyl-tRNA--protein transferase [Variovorax sp. J2R1-6]
MNLPWLAPGDPLPTPVEAWGAHDPVPGLLAAGGALDVPTLLDAYRHAIFPWFSDDQPILWWSPDPRMTLAPASFRLHRSLRKVLQTFRNDARCEIRVDHSFDTVIRACSAAPREGQSGTWIVPAMVEAYGALHRAGHAHSVETWVDGELVGGLYCVAIGRAVFGESMFARRTDASKIALAALVCLCRRHGVQLIDCQQNTAHLASLGASEMPRERFVEHVARAREAPGLSWHFEPVYWTELLPARPSSTT